MDYHPPALKRTVSSAEMLLQGLLVAVIGSGLGIGAGAFLAGQSLPGSGLQAQDSGSAAGEAIVASVQVVHAASIQHGKVSAGRTAQDRSAAQAARRSPTRIPVPKASLVAEEAGSQTSPGRQAKLVSSLIGTSSGVRVRGIARDVAAENAPSALQSAAQAEPEASQDKFRYTIEGDQIEVGFDAQAGVISTEGASQFVVGEDSRQDAEVFHSREASANVHYRCDQDANCSLIVASVVVPNARLRSENSPASWTMVADGSSGEQHQNNGSN